MQIKSGRLTIKVRRIKRWLKQRLLSPVKTDGKLRLHLGCGTDYWPGYVNVDSSPTADCDLRMDYTRIADIYPPGSVTEIAIIHSFSYLRLWQAREFLADLYGLLEQGGLLIIELPDLAKCARKALESEGDLDEYLEAVRGLYAFDMGQIERKELFTPYAFGWASWHLMDELKKAGFRQVICTDPQTHEPQKWRDTRIEAVK